MIPPLPCHHPFRRQHSNRFWDTGDGGVQAHQRTRVERRQVWVERGAPHGLHGGGQAGDFERGPSRVPPTAPCLSAVSVPALMCHVSGGGFPGAAARSPAKLSLRQSGSLLPELCHTLPPQPPKCGFWGESGTSWTEPSAAPAAHREGQHRCRPPALPPHAGATRQPAGQAPHRKGQNQLCGSRVHLSSPPSTGPGQNCWLGASHVPPLSRWGSPWCGRSSPVCPRAPHWTSQARASSPRMTGACVVSPPGPALRAPDVPTSPLGGRLLRSCRRPDQWYELPSGAEQGPSSR